MEKKLSDMTLEELWMLFPIILKEHNPQYYDWYEDEKNNIIEAINGTFISRINHIGSSAVPGLIAKPTIDILLELSGDCDIHQIILRLKAAGWTIMSSEFEPDLNLVFNKGYTPSGYAEKVYHLHVRYLGDWNELYFRDYLIEHLDIAAEYAELKVSLLKGFENNRDGYTEAKSEFILEHTKRARMCYVNRYTPNKTT
ncbi:GrpB family protein [Anoxynatronum buryatiense]|uniref:GrpB domain, predicted nucleotidyltransferase, UPF0157 family n=1 Tax=Anoxynatronum buryatiense TaxID=489973 RepID=A0AA46AJX9_9CLOT|nr:GrpB family protein [Anoxynatronum buryatiense]SMP64261.1 GrpB domain, predicted nucleotidyltransferase, UPF0157 family [Anoxynatronum buryatiense]